MARQHEALSADAARIDEIWKNFCAIGALPSSNKKLAIDIAAAFEWAITEKLPGFEATKEPDAPGLGVGEVHNALGVSRNVAAEALHLLVDRGYLKERNKRSFQIASAVRSLPPAEIRSSSTFSVNNMLSTYDGGDILHKPVVTPFNKSKHQHLLSGGVKYLESFCSQLASNVDKNLLSTSINKLTCKEVVTKSRVLRRFRYANDSQGEAKIWWLEDILLLLDDNELEAFSGETEIRYDQVQRIQLYQQLEAAGITKPLALQSDVQCAASDVNAIPSNMLEEVAQQSELQLSSETSGFLKICAAHFACPNGMVALSSAWLDPEIKKIRLAEFAISN